MRMSPRPFRLRRRRGGRDRGGRTFLIASSGKASEVHLQRVDLAVWGGGSSSISNLYVDHERPGVASCDFDHDAVNIPGDGVVLDGNADLFRDLEPAKERGEV